MQLGHETFTILSIADISEMKMRAILERMFFHDALNLACGIKGLAEILKDDPADPVMTVSMAGAIFNATEKLIDEINAQKELQLAEKGELTYKVTSLSALDIINSVASFYRNHDVADGKIISLDMKSDDIELNTDPVLLNRILGNMLKNALEAIPKGGGVSIACYQATDPWKFEFRVSNPGAIPQDIQLSIFQKAFSTKGAGRGLGTYGMKLLGETYLKGNVSFMSNEKDGTTFILRLK